MKFPIHSGCEECTAILRELREAAESEGRALRSSGLDLTELRQEWIHADEEASRALFAFHYPRSLVARRRKTEHEILTGHNVLTHGIWAAFRRR